MRAGILTFHEADNYGAVLQAYALQQTLMNLGAHGEFITIDMERKKRPEPEAAKDIRLAAFAKKVQMESNKRSALFQNFRDEYFTCSRAYGMKEMTQLNADFDCFVAGSDQIWNFQIPDTDGRYFLPFAAPEKRFSYAASFGGHALPEKMEKWCKSELEKFNKISVREEIGRRLIKELTGRDAAVSVDPTLLLDRAAWENLTHDVEEPPYVLLFLLKYDEYAVAKAKEIAEKEGLQLKVITAAFIPQLGFPAWSDVGVTDWLSFFKNASCVITNSFHGVVFSILFERRFHVARLQGELSARNGRIEELLRNTGLSAAMDEMPEAVDYEPVKMHIMEMRKASMDYLKEVVG